MALAPGTRFGPYRVVEQIGSGGMGEVWRATDTTLRRDVALKVLPQTFIDDPDRLARFQREAEILASLNHPNVATIHGLEKTDDQTVIVMELVEGPTLADRIKDGPIAPDEAMSIAFQIVAALEAAHGKGIVHRDLKPANVKVKGDGAVKVLDFGISKPIDPAAISGGAPVATTPAMTQTGVILGTAAYMSPEQARGRFVDERTDIWAFGCLLFEMLTGQPAFAGEDVMAILARVIDRDTDLSSMPGTISPAFRHTIGLCLQKDPQKRIADIRDVRLSLEGGFERESVSSELKPAVRTGAIMRLGLPAATLVLGIILASGAAWLLLPAEDTPITRFVVDLVGPPEQFATVALSPDGQRFVYRANDRLYIHRLDQGDATEIAGSADGYDAFFSPDGNSLAFFTNGQVKTVGLGGEIPRIVANVTPNGIVGLWASGDRLIFGQSGPYGLSSVPFVGGEPQPFAELGEYLDLDYPDALPGGDWVLFTGSTTQGDWSSAQLVAQNTTSGERKVVLEGGHFGRYVPTGHLVFARDATLYAVAFDEKRIETVGPEVPVVQGIETDETGGSATFSVSESGTLVYASGGDAEAPVRSVVWVTRDGDTEPLPLRPDNYTLARISPDGTKVAIVVGAAFPASDPLPDIYIFDLETENLTQLTFAEETDDSPIWSRDGSLIYFRSYREYPNGALYVIPASGGVPELLANSETGNNPNPWSLAPDDETILIVDAVSFDDVNLASFVIGGDEGFRPMLDLDLPITEPSLSPDGEWMTYHEDVQGGGQEINVRPFPNVTQGRRPVAEGRSPVFSAQGSELFFFDGGGLSSVAVEYEPFRVGVPRQLFRGQFWYGAGGPDGLLGRAWDVDPSGDRFLMITMPNALAEDGNQARPQMNVVLNWFEELQALVPTD